jgi:hypothetical protein
MRFLVPLVQTRDFGMTPTTDGLPNLQIETLIQARGNDTLKMPDGSAAN